MEMARTQKFLYEHCLRLKVIYKCLMKDVDICLFFIVSTY